MNIDKLVDEMIGLRKSRYTSLNRDNYIADLKQWAAQEANKARLDELLKAQAEVETGINMQYFTRRLYDLNRLTAEKGSNNEPKR